METGTTYYLAVDIGASSGRHILGHVADGKIVLEEIYRFDNIQVRHNGHDCWNTQELFHGILSGMEACQKAGKIPSYMAIDTWGVDFVLLDADGNMVGDAVAYRDTRTEHMDRLVEEKIPAEKLYAATGIQKQIFNTIYQFMALQNECPEQLEQAQSMLMIPDYFNFLLTGVQKQEYTNATTSGLVNVHEKQWDGHLLEVLGLPKKLFVQLSMPGEEVGMLKPEIKEKVGFDCMVLLPATHDTGSAFLAVPARDAQAVYLSSGTWSLLGVENEVPITTPESRQANFTNEGGYKYRFRYLKNIMGLWMLQSIRREFNGVNYVEGKGNSQSKRISDKELGFPDMIRMAKECADFPSVVDVDDPCFLSPESMVDAVKACCARTGQQVPETPGEVLQCVYSSLSQRYAQSIHQLEQLTGKTYTSINIVGGGCQDMYLNEMTAKASGLPVYAGPIEGTALGNLMVQMLYNKEFSDLQEARNAVKTSFDIKALS